MTDSSTTPAPDLQPPKPPPVVPDYEVFPHSIGHGNYGRVFLARDVLGNWRAVKVVYRSGFESDTPYEREWQGIRRFEPVSRTHPSQVNILHVHRDDAAGCFWYVMELADDAASVAKAAAAAEAASGEDTSGTATPPEPSAAFDPARYTPRTLAHDLKTQGRLSFDECLNIGLALATALDHLHKHSLVHRDIKPGNIVFVNGIPKLADIGTVTGAGLRSFVGTEGYYPPEGPGTPAADVFGLGRVLYEMMTGLDRTEFSRLPPGFENWEGHDRWRALNEVILRAGTGNLADRYHSADELHRDLVVVQAGRSIQQQEVLRRHLKALRRVLVGLTLAAVVAGGVLYERGLRQESERRLAQQRAELSEESRQQLQREARLREAVTLRTGDRWEDWSTDALAKLRGASQIRMGEDLRTEATAVLAGLDTRTHHLFRHSAARHLAFDAQGRRLLFDSGGEGETRLWDQATDQVTSLLTTNCGPVWFANDGIPRQFAYAGHGVFTIRRLNEQKVVQEFALDVEGSLDDLGV
ncbi:MAG TPA: protein kinase, partial [Verrucomicrobiota bacterium]|nr:protein kinase [Verrucomicrobiota bacterium]